MMNSKQKLELYGLMNALCEGTITDDEFDRLETWLKSDKEACKLYVDFTSAWSDLQYFHTSLYSRRDQKGASILDMLSGPESFTDSAIWKALADAEKKAPVVEIFTPDEPRVLIQKVHRQKVNRQISKMTIFSLFASAAAILLIFVFAHFAPQATGFKVAVLSDSIHAKWADMDRTMGKGTPILTSRESLLLREGYVKLLFDNHAQVTIEGPTEFQILEEDKINLRYGKIYAIVPSEATGFMITTETTKVVDLGTEFGLQADVGGSSELHVIKGKVQLFAGPQKGVKSSLVVIENKAVRYDASKFKIDEIPIQKQGFVRFIDSKSQVVWRGQTHINLADIIGGGDGSGNGRLNSVIQWDGQKLVDISEMPSAGKTPQPYVAVGFNPFIDGIFIPNSRYEPATLSSTFEELKLDEFLKQDTNGLITLMMLREDSDDASIYWFYSKEGAAGDRARMPFLYFPKGSSGQPAVVTTADGQGADTYITNDILNRHIRRYGKSSYLQCRYIKDERLRIIYLRFDISQLNDLSGAVLNLCLETGNRKRTLDIYVLKDGKADFWDEETLDYHTAPGLKVAPLGNYEFDESQCSRLGTFRVIDNRGSAEPVVVSTDGAFKWMPPESVDQTAYAITNTDSLQSPDKLDRRIVLRLGKRFCGTPDNPSILMHANAGITFDLNALRKEHGLLTSFTAFCGLSPSDLSEGDTGSSPSASFYVLLDGQEVFSAVDLTPEDEPQAIDVDLSNQHRYLTLITMQGTDRTNDDDLCLFMKPRINLEYKSGAQ